MINEILISEKNYAEDMERIVVPYLRAREADRYFQGYDGKELHYIHYRAEEEKAAVIISHGFTESCRKYEELSFYFLNQGYSVFLPEHRGHGQSYRKVADLTLTHIDRFDEYVTDLEIFIDTVVKKETDVPLFFFAHSMGGAVGALYMEEHPDTFAKAVLSSPMIAPCAKGIPVFLGRSITRFFKIVGKARERAFISGEYPGFEEYEGSCTTSPARFSYYEQKKRSTNYLQNYSPSYSWVHESLGVTRKILRKGKPERVKTKVYLFSAENDTVVERKPQQQLAKRLHDARFAVVEGAKHEIFLSGDEVLKKYLETVFDFLKS